MCGRMSQRMATLRYRDGSAIAVAKITDPDIVVAKGRWCGHVRSENVAGKAHMKHVAIPGVTMVRHYMGDLRKALVRTYNKPVTLSGYARWINSGGKKFIGIFVETKDITIEGRKERWPVFIDMEPEATESFEEDRD